MVKTPQHLLRQYAFYALSLLGVLALLDAWSDYRDATSSRFARLEVEARLFAEHAELSLASAETVLTDVVGLVHDTSLDEVASALEYAASLRRRLDQLPQLTSLAMVDSEGRVRFWSGGPTEMLGTVIGERDYFHAHRTDPSLRISAPVVGAGSGRYLVPVSMGLAPQGGAFAGIVVAMLDVNYFERFYALLPEASDRRLLMYLDNGALLTRSRNEASLSDSEQRIVPGWAPAERGIAPWGGRGEENLYVRKGLRGYPVEVAVGSPYSLLINALWLEWFWTAVILIALGGGALFAIRMVRRALRVAEQANENTLRQAQEQHRAETLAREITRRLPSGRVAVLDAELRYVFAEGKPLADELGLDNAALIGQSLADVHPPPSAQALTEIARTALTGAESGGEIAYGDRCYKVIGAPLRDEADEVEQVLLLAQDITEFKQIQKTLQVRNKELECLSYTDPLLGIANRRAFDEALPREWRRARRRSLPLALLLVDVDRFKLYNDSYGHSEGDQALIRVGKALRRAVSRPADLVARYGGEEFVVLLPETDEKGAQEVAGRIHRGLAEAAIPFPVAPAPGRLTVSIGLAAIIPVPGVHVAGLMQAADRALYAAKEGGRNRTVAGH
ncbi:diguanylate cyclase domain-containing protein [Alkalilimnicola sp. S0819]|uniref:diguanylate cyclase domain-containing protein n=1 Tax=Alkalilimnicola sp. S0819 TaxID=2613922 RepID=UPI001261D1DC|nr:diguanylate cyclase [Alkalilimnicola sp. S0819]KAB7627595.1 diguanylate cyclase [Alkalilimnicola sp. S0819]MPQ15757.1 diguanylate cyclase [Alkalilimnicola sp. S0819]